MLPVFPPMFAAANPERDQPERADFVEEVETEFPQAFAKQPQIDRGQHGQRLCDGVIVQTFVVGNKLEHTQLAEEMIGGTGIEEPAKVSLVPAKPRQDSQHPGYCEDQPAAPQVFDPETEKQDRQEKHQAVDLQGDATDETGECITDWRLPLHRKEHQAGQDKQQC